MHRAQGIGRLRTDGHAIYDRKREPVGLADPDTIWGPLGINHCRGTADDGKVVLGHLDTPTVYPRRNDDNIPWLCHIHRYLNGGVNHNDAPRQSDSGHKQQAQSNEQDGIQGASSHNTPSIVWWYTEVQEHGQSWDSKAASCRLHAEILEGLGIYPRHLERQQE